jgi:hypothetical protein
LRLAGGIRWNAVYLMIERALKVRFVIQTFQDEEMKEHGYADDDILIQQD